MKVSPSDLSILALTTLYWDALSDACSRSFSRSTSSRVPSSSTIISRVSSSGIFFGDIITVQTSLVRANIDILASKICPRLGEIVMSLSCWVTAPRCRYSDCRICREKSWAVTPPEQRMTSTTMTTSTRRRICRVSVLVAPCFFGSVFLTLVSFDTSHTSQNPSNPGEFSG